MAPESKNQVWQSRVELELPAGFSPPEEPLWPPLFDPAPAHTLYQDPGRNTLVFEIFLTREPGPEELTMLTRAAADFLGVALEPLFFTLLEKKDWVKESLKALSPIEAGRFFVFGSHDAGNLPDGKIPLLIEATLAFGTGHHETTQGCLLAIDKCAETIEPKHVFDLGCGSGILAFAIKKAWPGARVMASDTDKIAIKIARENAAKNDCQEIEFIQAEGFAHRAFSGRSFDLITANILSGPLVDLAPEMEAHLNPSGILILSGILKEQQDWVLDAYEKVGFELNDTFSENSWPTLVLARV